MLNPMQELVPTLEQNLVLLLLFELKVLQMILLIVLDVILGLKPVLHFHRSHHLFRPQTARVCLIRHKRALEMTNV